MSVLKIVDVNPSKEIDDALGIKGGHVIGLAKINYNHEEFMAEMTSKLSSAQFGKENLKKIEKNIVDMDKFTGNFIIVMDSNTHNLTLKKANKKDEITYRNQEPIEVELSLIDNDMLDYLLDVKYIDEPGTPRIMPHANVTDGKGIIDDGKHVEFAY